MSFGAPKAPAIDTSAQDRALKLQEDRAAKLDAQEAATKKTQDARRRGRNLLMSGADTGTGTEFGARQ